MIDVSSKPSTLRFARARAVVAARPETVERVRAGSVPKGDALEMARAAGLLAAKRTSELIPLCHPIPLDHVSVEFETGADTITINTTATAVWKTGVEMEALVAASTAALVLVDMLKPIDRELEIRSVRVLEKRGGRSDAAGSLAHPIRAAVLVASDSAAAGEREDRSGRSIVEAMKPYPVEVVEYAIVPDERGEIEAALRRLSDEAACDLVVTTGGTGPGPRDVTVEAAAAVLDRELPGVMETARAFGQSRTPTAMLSRGTAGLRGRTLIVTLPGSVNAVEESLAALLPGLLHAVHVTGGGGHDAEGVHAPARAGSREPAGRRDEVW